MKKLIQLFIFVGAIAIFSGFSSSEKADNKACWGQVSAVFAQMGEMGEHASQQPTPRLGLRNLAHALFDAGVLAEDSMEALGQFVMEAYGLSIEACL